jgi:hypothetical protein
VLPPEDYQGLFQDLQKTLSETGLPVNPVRIPHATVVAAKVIDQKQEDTWQELEGVQRTYRSFLLYHVHNALKESPNFTEQEYNKTLQSVLTEQEATLAKIASTTTEEQALALTGEVQLAPATDGAYEKIREMATKQINETSFALHPTQVKLSNNGSIIFQLSEDDKLLQMRLNLIIAGQGIAKWPKLSVMKNAWSTVGYTTKVLTNEEKSKLDVVLDEWTKKNQDALSKTTVKFDAEHLGGLAFRSNDFQTVKKAVFPVIADNIPKLNLSQALPISEEDLRFTPRTGNKGITPRSGERPEPVSQEKWNRVINEEVK